MSCVTLDGSLLLLGSFAGSFFFVCILALRGVRIDVNLPVCVISTGGDRHPLDPWFVGMSNAVYLVLANPLNIVEWRVLFAP